VPNAAFKRARFLHTRNRPTRTATANRRAVAGRTELAAAVDHTNVATSLYFRSHPGGPRPAPPMRQGRLMSVDDGEKKTTTMSSCQSIAWTRRQKTRILNHTSPGVNSLRGTHPRHQRRTRKKSASLRQSLLVLVPARSHASTTYEHHASCVFAYSRRWLQTSVHTRRSVTIFEIVQHKHHVFF
jgi:hypothetical protein